MPAKKSTATKAVKKRTPKPKLITLHAMLTRAFPEHRTIRHNVIHSEWLAAKLKITSEAIYVWFRNNKLPYTRAVAIVKIPGCRITLEELLPYCN